MKISIVTATYNSAATLRDTIESIQNQQYSNIEYLVIDGCSKDDTVAIAKAYPDLVSHLVSEPDKGIYDAMNKGIARATGDVVGILNSDDFYAHERVLAQVAKAFEKPHIDAVYGDLQYVQAEQPNQIVRHWRAGDFHYKQFRYGWMPPHPTFFVRRELYDKYGVFDTSFRSAADYELMLRFLYKHRAVAHYIPEVLVKMRTGGMSNANFRHRLRANREDLRAWRVNGLRPYFFTTLLKPIRKLNQFYLFTK
ncbi:MAG: glycosyltransferase family 2 protein [Saprospiraceae bacterium]